ncbi:hypothetical protein UlMin_044614 [Ulmus minor]
MGLVGGRGLISRASKMKTKLQSCLEASLLEIEDASYQYAAVKSNPNAAASQTLVKRHRMVYDALADELKSGLHALSIVAKMPNEVEARTPNSSSGCRKVQKW